MFVPTRPHVNGAPEILHGAQHSAPRSWDNLERWRVRESRPNVVHHEQERSGTASMSATLFNDHTNRRDRVGQPRQRHSTRLTAFKHAIIFLAFSVPLVFLALVVKVPEWYAFESDYWLSKSFTHCNFNGDFTPSDRPSVSLWDPSGFFYITVSWGKMAFSTAKFIDIVWDILVGRGGQALLAFITFKVSSQYLAMAMWEAPVSYNTFESLAFVPPSLIRTGRLAGDLLTNRGWRARLIITWVILSSLFVLSFSSLINAMSGYSSDINAIMLDYENETILWSNFQVVQFAINDAERIGHTGPLFVTIGDTCVEEGFLDDDDDDDDNGGYDHSESPSLDRNRRRGDSNYDQNGDGGGNVSWNYVPANCSTFWRTVQYVSAYGLDGRNQTDSTITLNGFTHTIAAPALNVTTSYSPVALSTLKTYLNTFSESSPPAPGALSSVSQFTVSTFWLYNNQTYPLSYVLDNATCRYSSWHNWGFSFLFLFITSLFLAIWAIGTYALWLYTYLHSVYDRVPGQDATGGVYRSSWTLVEAMKRDVGPGAVTPETNEREIRNLIRRRRGRVIHGVGNIDTQPSRTLAEPEKNPTSSPSTTSPVQQFHSTRWAAFRTWLFPSAYSHNRNTEGLQTPANSVFRHADLTLSSTSQHPILQSPAAPARTMTMTSRLSSLASPFTDSPPEFGFPAAAEADIINQSGVGSSLDPISGIPTLGTGTGATRPRPRLSLSRAIRSSTHAPNTPRTAASLPSASSATGKWVALSSPGPVTPSDDSIFTISPIREDRMDVEKQKNEEDAVKWRNDLGDD